MKTALIAGSSGLIGSQLLDLLLKSDSYTSVISVARRKLDIENDKLIQCIVDFDEFEIDTKEDIDDVFCCLGTTMKVAGSKEKFRQVDFQYPMVLANWAYNHGAKSLLLVSSMGADANSSVFYSKVKGELEEAIIRIGLGRIDIFRPSLLLGPRQESRIGESIGKLFMQVLSVFFIGPLKNYKAIDSHKVAKAMLSLAGEIAPGNYTHLSSELQKY